eukprot:6184926-Pleurochrysis_carterae.AAC.1
MPACTTTAQERDSHAIRSLRSGGAHMIVTGTAEQRGGEDDARRHWNACVSCSALDAPLHRGLCVCDCVN